MEHERKKHGRRRSEENVTGFANEEEEGENSRHQTAGSEQFREPSTVSIYAGTDTIFNGMASRGRRE